MTGGSSPRVAFTVALAYLVLHERISSVQGLGLALAAASVALIGA